MDLGLLGRTAVVTGSTAGIAFVAGTTATTAVGQEHPNSDMLPRSALI
jgi:hypothetical protein